jgi:iron complex outermembrane receptor protein
MMTFKRLLISSVSVGIMLNCGLHNASAQQISGPIVGGDSQEIVVQGIKQSLEKAIELKRLNDNQVEAISAEDIGKLPDKNVADALQRLPGINTSAAAGGEGGFDENDRVSIRGTSPSLTSVTFDGHSISTGDWFILDQAGSSVGRSISFTLLPSEIIGSALVYKTQEASMMEGGVSGSVDLISRNPLDFKQPWTFEASLEGAYNSLTNNTKPQINALVGWHNNINTFGIIVQGFYEDRTLRRYGQEVVSGYDTIKATDATGKAHPDLVGVQAPHLIGSALFEQQRTREGANLAFQWRPNTETDIKLSSFYSDLNATNLNNNYMYWGSNEYANNVPSSYTVKNNTLIAATFPTTPGVSGIVQDNIVRPNAEAWSYFVNLDGKYRPNQNIILKGQIGYTEGKGYTPESPTFESQSDTGVSFSPSGNGYRVTPLVGSASSPSGLYNGWSWNETHTSLDNEVYGKFDADFVIDKGFFNDVLFGFRIADHSRTVDGWSRGCQLAADNSCWPASNATAMSYTATNPTGYPSSYTGSALGIPGLAIPTAGNKDTIISIINNVPGGVRGPISAIKQPQNYLWGGSFKIDENDYAGYVEARASGERWRGNIGIRLVETQLTSFVNVQSDASAPGAITTSAYGAYVVDKVNHNYLIPLPSINFSYDISKDIITRFSVAETMSRPDYGSLAGSVSLTDLTHTGNGGNPNLKPTQAAVYSESLEWYYMPKALAALSIFYDDLQTYVTYSNRTGNYYDALTNSQASYVISSPNNTSGSLKGFEFQWQQPLPYDFGIQANYTYVDGSETSGAPLVGTSRSTFNLVGYYENNYVSARLAYTFRSHYFVGLDRSSPQTQDGYGTLDSSINVPITKNASFNFDVLNITNNLLKYYAANKTQILSVYDNGTQFYAGIRVKY